MFDISLSGFCAVEF